MPSRRFVLLLMATLMGLAGSTAWESAASRAQQGDPSAEIASLQEQLENGLKAHRPSDFEFIDHVVQMVAADELPLALVKSTFQWVRKNRGSKKYLVPYFERALRVRAARLGIEV